jgi:hypothetical protein
MEEKGRVERKGIETVEDDDKKRDGYNENL